MGMVNVVDTGEMWGVWVWQLPDGTFLQDDERNHLSMNGMRYDVRAMALMKEEATALGFPDGEPRFIPGRQKVTQAQWEVQQEALRDGRDIDTVLHKRA